MPGAHVNGFEMAYRVEGPTDGPSLVIMHGGFAGHDPLWQFAQVFATTGWRVFLPDRRGHGSSPDVPGPLTYEAMADDAIKFADVVPGPACYLGWGDGAVVAALLAMQRPRLVRRLALVGQYFHPSGQTREAAEMIDAIAANPDFVRRDHDRFSPHGPDHFPVVFEKMTTLLRRGPSFDLGDLARISADTLVMQGDRDIVTVEHSAALAHALPSGALAVLPGGPGLLRDSPAASAAVVTDFLSRGRPSGVGHE